MNRSHRFVTQAIAVSALAIGLTASASAQTFELDWFSIDGGGGSSSGGDFSLTGTIGQPDSETMSGGEFTLVGGFWAVAAVPPGCVGDLDGDGDTDLADLGILLADFGCTGGGCAGDLDGDGDTDLADLGILLADFGCAP